MRKFDRNTVLLVILVVVFAAAGAYYFWDGYHPARSIAAGLASLFLGMLGDFLMSGWSGPDDKSKDLPPVIR